MFALACYDKKYARQSDLVKFHRKVGLLLSFLEAKFPEKQTRDA